MSDSNHEPSPGHEHHLHRGPLAWRPLRVFGLGVVAVALIAVGAGAANLVFSPRATGMPVARGAAIPTHVMDPLEIPQLRSADLAIQAQPHPAAAPVLLLGDSLAVGISYDLQTSWSARVISMDAEVGRSTPTQAAILAPYAASSPPVWVVSLGTNDSPDTFPAAARQIVRLAGPRRCLVWFDVHRPSTQDAINAELHQLADRHRNVHLLDWSSLAAANPQWFGSDGIHPTTDGYTQRAQLAVQGVAQWCTQQPAH